MVESQEIIERSIYFSLLNKTISEGYTVDPANYQPPTSATAAQYQQDINSIIATKDYFISIFGSGNNQAKGEVTVPRMVINPRGYMPGDVGLERHILTKDSSRYVVSEFPYEAIDQFIDIHLLANTQESLRTLVILLERSIPVRGYIKPYIYQDVPFEGNIFIELMNFYDTPNLYKGVMEKVYQYQVKDTLLFTEDLPDTLPALVDISLLLSINGEESKELIHKTI